MNNTQLDYDYIIIGSGFGGSVSAFRLAEKGYKILVIEKGKSLKEKDFPKTNWNLKRFFWIPTLKMAGLCKLTFFRHISIVSGVGVGGGSLVYANTLPVPKDDFFKANSWAHLADWKAELMPHYEIAKQMLGANENPYLQYGDLILQEIAEQAGKKDTFRPTNVAVYFGKPGIQVADPYFDGIGPPRKGCIQCGACCIGCRHNAKNTLDKNYLYLAQKLGVEILAEHEVVDVFPLDGEGETGYKVSFKHALKWFGKKQSLTAKSVIFAGGVLGTLKLLLKLKKTSLPNLSDQLGQKVRTNYENLISVTSFNKKQVLSDGIAIGSIYEADNHMHAEPVRYPSGSGVWRLFCIIPMVQGANFFIRLFEVLKDIIKSPIQYFKVIFVNNWAKRTQLLLFMQTKEETLQFKKGWFRGLATSKEKGSTTTTSIPEVQEIATQFAKKVNGKPMMSFTEALFGIPSTAHILGGCIMGKNIEQGVIDKDNYVFAYKNLMVCDGSMISANPGVNPSLTITALTERAMSKIKAKH